MAVVFGGGEAVDDHGRKIERATLPDAETISLAEALRERARFQRLKAEEEKRRGASGSEDGADSLPGQQDRG